jgi:hypothetical protein
MSITTTNNSIIPTEDELKSYQFIAKVASSNQSWKKLGGGGSEEQVVATILSVMLLARELGVSPMQAISGGINNILGKFEISARIMNQLIRKHGHKIQVTMLTNEVCKILGKRRDTGEEMEASYHIEEAARAGLIKEGGGWRKNPQDMLFARTISRLARRLFPDCIGGCYVEGELQETVLKQSVQGFDVPSVDEINVFPEEIEQRCVFEFEIPSDISRVSVENFINESATFSGKSVGSIYKRANQNPEGFLNALRSWEEKTMGKVHEEEKMQITA